MASHRIHLRGPWEFIWLKSTDSDCDLKSKTGTVAMPREWQELFGNAAGTVQFRRKFHRPTNLEQHERVMVVFTGVRGTGCVRLNERIVGHFTAMGDAVEFEISTVMSPFNELAVDIAFDPRKDQGLSGGLFGVVALEIRSE